MGKFKKLLKTFFYSVAVSTIVFTSAYTVNLISVSNETQGPNYKKVELVDSDAELFGAEGEYNYNVSDYFRLKHNDKDPIHVYIEKGFNEEDVGLIKKSLNYFEDLFKNINDKYKFDYISENQYNISVIKGDTTIKYELADLEPSYVNGENKTQTFIFNPTFIKKSIIRIENDLQVSNVDEKYYIYLHELAHAFGLKDVYMDDEKIYYGNTLIQSSELQKTLNKVSPEDYRKFQAMYNISHINEDGTVNEEKLKIILENIKNYDSEFYKYVVDTMTNYLTSVNRITQDISKSDAEKYKFSYTYSDAIDTTVNKIHFDDEKYYWDIYKNNQLIFSSDGKYLEQDGVILIPSINIKNPTFRVSYYFGGIQQANVMIAFFKNQDTYYMAPVDTLTFYEMKAEEKSLEQTPVEQVAEF
ncbi:MAG: hypothetical protein WCR30_04480 [Clostridia bacterium]